MASIWKSFKPRNFDPYPHSQRDQDGRLILLSKIECCSGFAAGTQQMLLYEWVPHKSDLSYNHATLIYCNFIIICSSCSSAFHWSSIQCFSKWSVLKKILGKPILLPVITFSTAIHIHSIPISCATGSKSFRDRSNSGALRFSAW